MSVCFNLQKCDSKKGLDLVEKTDFIFSSCFSLRLDSIVCVCVCMRACRCTSVHAWICLSMAPLVSALSRWNYVFIEKLVFWWWHYYLASHCPLDYFLDLYDDLSQGQLIVEIELSHTLVMTYNAYKFVRTLRITFVSYFLLG